ncbi:hypothetical protein [Actinomyces israelii]|uniref:hypothetical protein n=1 Tax=Actinomyces israelii TaxID=1659 RepID=UPI00235341D6|nr:hypothetical protein [Actinomyces israelii]
MAVGLPADVLGGESRPALGEELRQQVVAEVPDCLAQRYCPTGRNAAPDGEGQQRAAQHQGPPHGRADVDIGGAVPDVPAIEPGDQEIEAGQHPVAGGEASRGVAAVLPRRADGSDGPAGPRIAPSQWCDESAPRNGTHLQENQVERLK